MCVASVASCCTRHPLVPRATTGIFNGMSPCHAKFVHPFKRVEETDQDERFQCCYNKSYMALLRMGMHVQLMHLKSHLSAPWDVLCYFQACCSVARPFVFSIAMYIADRI